MFDDFGTQTFNMHIFIEKIKQIDAILYKHNEQINLGD